MTERELDLAIANLLAAGFSADQAIARMRRLRGIELTRADVDATVERIRAEQRDRTFGGLSHA